MPSNYGKGNWGVELYSQSSTWSFVGNLAPSVAFSASFSPLTGLAGGLATTITFGPSQLTTPQNIVGDLAPVVAFAANLSLIYAVAGDLAPQTALGASLTGDWLVQGDMAPGVEFAASIGGGPLWAVSQPCPPSAWDETEPCPPAMWTPVAPPQWQLPDVTGSYGLGPYGGGPYNVVTGVSPWQEAELCDGG
jgi:hypothetical protein